MDPPTLLIIAGAVFALAMLGLTAGFYRRRSMPKGCCGQTAEYQDERGTFAGGTCGQSLKECAEQQAPEEQPQQGAAGRHEEQPANR